MLPLQFRIDRTRRFLQMLEDDASLLDARFAALSRDRRKRAKTYAAILIERTRAEIARLTEEHSLSDDHDCVPQAAD